MNFADALLLHGRGLLSYAELRWLIWRALKAKGFPYGEVDFNRSHSQPQTPSSAASATAPAPVPASTKPCGCRSIDLCDECVLPKGYTRPVVPSPTCPSENPEPAAKVEQPSPVAKKTVRQSAQPAVDDFFKGTEPQPDPTEHDAPKRAPRTWTEESSRKRQLSQTGTLKSERSALEPGQLRQVRKAFDSKQDDGTLREVPAGAYVRSLHWNCLPNGTVRMRIKVVESLSDSPRSAWLADASACSVRTHSVVVK